MLESYQKDIPHQCVCVREDEMEKRDGLGGRRRDERETEEEKF